jgi:hypothetical protein
MITGRNSEKNPNTKHKKQNKKKTQGGDAGACGAGALSGIQWGAG